MKKLRRILIISGIVLLSLFVLAFIFISPITKYLIEKYSVAYIGRQIRMDKLYINLVTGNLSSEGLKIYEKDQKTVFFSCGQFSGHIALYKLWRGRYDITRMEFLEPELTVLQHGKTFNFSDLVQRFGGNDSPDTADSSPPVQYWIRNLILTNSHLIYINQEPYNKVEIIKGNLSIPLIAWDNDQYDMETNFVFPAGGSVKSALRVNGRSGAYQLNMGTDSLNLAWLFPYLKDYMKVNRLDGFLGTHFHLQGNTNTPQEIIAGGDLELGDISIVDNANQPLITLNQMKILIDSINTKENLYNVRSVEIRKPFLNLAVYDDGSNLDRLTKTPASGPGASDSVRRYSNLFTLLAAYTQDLINHYVISRYNAGTVAVSGGRLLFTDYTLEDKFQIELDSLEIRSEKISSTDSLISLDAGSLVNQTGTWEARLKISPKNYSDFDIEGSVNGLYISAFNPYSKYYLAVPFLNGRIFYRNTTVVQNRQLLNDNELDILQIRTGRRVKSNTATKMPVRLAVSLLKDVNGDIHLSVPIRGSLDDPKFRWGKIVWQVLKNLMLKAVAAPFKLLAGKFGGTEDSYRQLPFQYGETKLNPAQVRQLDLLAEVLQKEEAVSLELVQMLNRRDEAEYLAVREVKKRFLGFSSDSLTADQARQVQELSVRDSALMAYINQRIGPVALQSIQEKCIQLYGGEAALQVQIASEMKKRNDAIRSYFLEKGISPDRVGIRNMDENKVLSGNGQPRYRIELSSVDKTGGAEEKK